MISDTDTQEEVTSQCLIPVSDRTTTRCDSEKKQVMTCF
jgi:hypothetical protein